MGSASRYNPARRGVTLVELLVVVGILVLLMSIAIPAIQPAMETQRLRAASRTITAYFGAARIHALETGRPCGVLLERAKGNEDACVTLRQVEVPPPYAGDTPTSKVKVLRDLQLFHVKIQTGDFLYTEIYLGDLVQLGLQGPLYKVWDVPNDTGAFHPANGDPSLPFDFSVQGNDQDGWVESHYLILKLDGPFTAPWSGGGTWSSPVSFQIFRQPGISYYSATNRPSPSVAPPLQLPRGVVLDLWTSGSRTGTLTSAQLPPDHFFAHLNVEDNSNSGIDTRPVIILFSPAGSVDVVYRSYYDDTESSPRQSRWGPSPWGSSIYLLVGRADRMDLLTGRNPATGSPWTRTGPVPPEDGLSNWQDITNFWLALNPQNGEITAAPNAPDTDSSQSPPKPTNLAAARRFALETQLTGKGAQ